MTIDDDTAGHASEAPDGHALPKTGDVIARYRIVKLLGRGGMGAVFLADDEALQRRVALKLILSTRAEPAERQRFEREARSAARLSHRGIATVYDVGESDGRPWLAMEFVQGATLASRIKKGPLAQDELVLLARELSDALSSAHAAGVVHRDIKPGNIMWSDEGQVKLLDFGLARNEGHVPVDDARAHDGPITATGIIIGTPSYMSPEQARGERVGLSSDVFSLGTVLHEAATGRCPFDGKNVFAILSAVLSTTPPSLRILRPDIPFDLADVIMRCLEREPGARFPSAVDVRQALTMRIDTSSSHAADTHPKTETAMASVADDAFVDGRVVVLPLKNLSRDPNHDWLGAGITDTIAHELRRSDGLAVVDEARLMPVLMSGAASEPTSVARALAAQWVVAGAYQVAGGRVRISCTVTDGATGEATPCERIDGGLDEIFDLQDRLVSELRRLLGSSRRGSTSKEVKLAPETYEAYEWYARAHLAFHQLTAESSVEAEQCLKNALSRDPDYALAHAALGASRVLRFLSTGTPPLSEATPSFMRAIELNPELAEAHLWLSHARMMEGRYDVAVEAARVATKHAPKQGMAWINLGLNLALQAIGDKKGPAPLVDAISALATSLDVEPDNASAYSNIGLFLLVGGAFAPARVALERGAAANAGAAVGGKWIGFRSLLAYIESLEGRHAVAERELALALDELEGSTHIFARPVVGFTRIARADNWYRAGDARRALGHFTDAKKQVESESFSPGMWHNALRAEAGIAKCLATLGDAEGARRALAESKGRWRDEHARRISGFAASAPWTAIDLAGALAVNGESDAALAMLDEAHAHAFHASIVFDGDPAWNALRDDPRYMAARARADHHTALLVASLK